MKNVKTIFVKELKRIFTDRRMLLALFMPGILIFVLYTVMGNIMHSQVVNTSVNNVEFVVAYSDNYGNTEKPKIITYFETVVKSSDDGNTAKTYPYTIADHQKELGICTGILVVQLPR